MDGHHLTLGANLLLWVFPLVLTVAVIVLALVERRRPEDSG